ncbi:transposase [Mycobacterium sp. SM1]|uniref:transposase n=1 Tax=Mycobacterium sp. SM1 TaxID=2816243 RepID=UPI001BCB6ABC|nr:transposase [Mycobacterium sp. SM1]
MRCRAERLSQRAWDRLRNGLLAGDPGGQLTAACSIAQDLMRCYQLRDASAAAAVITAARDCPAPEIARLGKTLHSCRAEFLAYFAHTDVSNGPTESLNLKIKNTKRTVGLTPDGGHLTGGTAGPAGRMSVSRASVASTPRSLGSRLPAW